MKSDLMKFTIAGALGQTFALLKQHRKALLKTWLGILVVMIFADILTVFLAPPTNVSYTGYGLVYVIYLMQVVSIIVSGEFQNKDVMNRSGSIITWSFLTLMLTMAIGFCGMFSYLSFTKQSTVMAALLLFVGLYLIHVACRLLPLLVSVACGVSKPLATTWEVTKGHSLRLFGVFTIIFILRVLPLVFFVILDVTFRIIFNINLEPNEWLLNIFVDCLLAAGTVLSLTLHSVAGLQLLGWEPENTNENLDSDLLSPSA